MKTTSYGKTKQHLFVGLLLGVILLSTQAQALSIEQAGPPICCQAYNAKCLSCAEGISEEEYCKKNPSFGGCEQYNCCQAVEAKCEACKQGISEEEYCRKNPQNFLGTPGCEKYQTPPENNCCQAVEARCEACKEGISEEEYCNRDPFFAGCSDGFGFGK